MLLSYYARAQLRNGSDANAFCILQGDLQTKILADVTW